MLNLKEADVTQTRFYQEVLDIGWQQGRLIENHYGHKSGHKIGRKIGRQIGWKEGRLNIVQRQLARRCGQLSIAQKSQVRSLSITQIETLAEALLDFKGTGDLEIWLRENLG
jgi:predicted transposase YdaD